MGGEDNLETFDAAIELAASYKLAVIEVMDGVTFGFHKKTEVYTLERVRKAVIKGNGDKENPTAVMGNVGHTQVFLLSFLFFLFFFFSPSFPLSPPPSTTHRNQPTNKSKKVTQTSFPLAAPTCPTPISLRDLEMEFLLLLPLNILIGGPRRELMVILLSLVLLLLLFKFAFSFERMEENKNGNFFFQISN